jgi:hypothetical protein
MRKLITKGSCILGTAVLFSVAAGCSRQPAAPAPVSTPTVHSSASTTIAGREIQVSIDVPAGMYPDVDPAAILGAGKAVSAAGPLAIYPENDTANIRFGSHQLRVEKERLSLDGKEGAKIPTSASRIDITISNATVRVSADTTNVFTTQITN